MHCRGVQVVYDNFGCLFGLPFLVFLSTIANLLQALYYVCSIQRVVLNVDGPPVDTQPTQELLYYHTAVIENINILASIL